MLGEVTYTDRGFERIDFKDCYGEECSLQQSSAIEDSDIPGASFVWLGANNVSGRADRMHLNKEQVGELVAHLVNWMNTGSFKE
jgi:hypothetical protein